MSVGDYLDRCGSRVPGSSSLSLSKARDFAETVLDEKTTGVELIDCRQSELSETVVVDLHVDLPRRGPRFDIRPVERLAVTFLAADLEPPDARALREDFPVLPHQNRKIDAPPLSLCYTETPYSDLKRHWTSAFLLEALSNWLRLSAKGRLHQEDQPLEPLLDSSRTVLIANRKILEHGDPVVVLPVPPARENQIEALLAVRQADLAGNESLARVAKDLAFRIAMVECPARTHGVIHRSPQNLAELDELLAVPGFDLIAELRSRFRSWKGDIEAEELQQLRRLQLLLVVALPKSRAPDGPVESTEHRAFVTKASIEHVGTDIGAWVVHDGHLVDWTGSEGAANSNRGEGTQLDGVRISWTLERDLAAGLSGRRPATGKVVALGVGALGSQVVSGLLRQGFGRWTLIDKDILLPHNTARHELTACYIGMSKAQALAQSLAPLLPDEPPPSFIHDDLLHPQHNQGEIEAAFQSAALVVDMSASLAVGRHLAFDRQTGGRRVSVFLSPSGTDLVVLAESQVRELDLFDLEAQYYREVATNRALAGHLPTSRHALRYSQGCRDVSAVLPLDAVAAHAAIATRAIQRLPSGAMASVWRLGDSGEVARLVVTLAEVQKVCAGDWNLRIDARVASAMVDERANKLQRETGGVLIGVIDTEAREMVVVGAIPSPRDSQEEGSLYIRGTRGLSARVREWSEASGGNLVYLGEWHSHPDRVTTDPSSDDLCLFDHLCSYMRPAGLPALMVIVGADRKATILIGRSSPQRQEIVFA